MLRATESLGRITEVTEPLLRRHGIRALLIDVDNTLALHGERAPFKGTVEWAHRMEAAGYRLMLLSNNFEKRVAPFAAQYGLPYLPFSCKPFPSCFFAAARRLGVRKSECAVIGDQIFTDIIGANLAGMKSILLEPIGEEKGRLLRFKRRLERPLRKRAEK